MNFIKLNQILILNTVSRLFGNKKTFPLVPHQSEKCIIIIYVLYNQQNFCIEISARIALGSIIYIHVYIYIYIYTYTHN